MGSAFTFSKLDRLLDKEDFEGVLRAAHQLSAHIENLPPYVVYRRPSDRPRLGISVARSVIRRAHDRNRIKRCIRDFFRKNKSQLSGDIFVRMTSIPLGTSYEALTFPLQRMLLKRPN
jgi:ribonuclease P protein component